MTERLVLSEKEIFTAEKNRASGNSQRAAHMTLPAVEFPIDQFADLSTEEQTRLLMATRIHVVSKISEANSSWRTGRVAGHLQNARKGIMNMRNPLVTEANISTDTRGNPYEFNTERKRDEINYFLALAGLTGNARYLAEAMKKMDELILHAGERTAQSEMIFRRDLLAHSQNPSKQLFSHLRSSYGDSIMASKNIGRWERVATIASRYAIESLRTGHPAEAAKGMMTCAQAAQKDPSTRGILLREGIKSITQPLRHTMWRVTSLNRRFSSLRLP